MHALLHKIAFALSGLMLATQVTAPRLAGAGSR